MNRIRFDQWMSAIAIVSLALALAIACSASGWTPRHALALPGTQEMPGHRIFNLLGFGVPGVALLSAALQRRWRSRDQSGMVAGIGLWLCAIAALAWTALGIFPIDAGDLAGEGSQHHAALWMVWLIAASAAFVASAICVKAAARGIAVVVAALWLIVVLVLPPLIGGWAQVAAATAWMAWPWLRSSGEGDHPEAPLGD
ncbi:hypothetical protein [Solilutibacter silvestris]|uniref:DUF998 domain-containing protein n=1 Tax=Solilutibacter silvestris TaxID=1645665 RepID=A0A2K1PY76_9GAMM|nr:hypothetical protein [Lysobacter silvestris]PNS07627.1 hypothetical protein Lysil_1803 [Lysobacter silvestris]